jgi:hypothetical protein
MRMVEWGVVSSKF